MNLRLTTFVWMGSCSFVSGVLLSQYTGYVSYWYLLPFIALIPLVWRRSIIALLILVCGCLLVGVARPNNWKTGELVIDSLQGETITMYGRVANDSVYDFRGQTQVDLDNLYVMVDDQRRDIKGKLRLSSFSQPLLLRHDELKVTGKLRIGFGTRIASMSFAEVEIIGRSTSPTESFRREFSAALASSLSDDQAALALGILVRQRTNLNDTREDQLRAAGLTHIIAVSGYNLSVLVRLTRRRLKWLSKFQSLVVSITLVVFFLLLAGNSASVVRAAWVIGISLGVGYYGRTIRPIALLMLSAAATAWFDPFYVWYDIGWWLSFAAFFGVLLIAPQLTSRIKRPKQIPEFLHQTILESFAASLMTMPLIMWVFGRVSIVSLLANTLVVPIIPLVMVTSFLAGALYFVLQSSNVHRVAIVLAAVGLNFILLVSEVLGDLSFAEANVTISLIQMLAMYGSLLTATYVLHRKAGAVKGYDLLE